MEFRRPEIIASSVFRLDKSSLPIGDHLCDCPSQPRLKGVKAGLPDWSQRTDGLTDGWTWGSLQKLRELLQFSLYRPTLLSTNSKSDSQVSSSGLPIAIIFQPFCGMLKGADTKPRRGAIQ